MRWVLGRGGWPLPAACWALGPALPWGLAPRVRLLPACCCSCLAGCAAPPINPPSRLRCPRARQQAEGTLKTDVPPFDMDAGGSGSDSEDENDPPVKQ